MNLFEIDDQAPDIEDRNNKLVALQNVVDALYSKLLDYEVTGLIDIRPAVLTATTLQNEPHVFCYSTHKGMQRYVVQFRDFINRPIKHEIERIINKLRLLFAQQAEARHQLTLARQKDIWMSSKISPIGVTDNTTLS